MSAHIAVDVAIIGGGTAGCSAALHLRRRGVSVALLEAGLWGGRSSGINFGGVRRQGRHPAELPLARLAREMWDRLPELVGTDCEFSATGHLRLARSEAEMARYEKYAEDVHDHDLGLELIGRNAIRQMCPWLGEAIIGGMHCPSDGQANPRLVAPAFARAARAAGADIREHARVTGALWDGARFRLTTESGIEVTAAHCINVAGAWADRIAAQFGEHPPLTAKSPNMIVTEPLPYFMKPNMGSGGNGVYIRQVTRGNVVFGGGEGVVAADRMTARVSPEVTRRDMTLAIEVAPRLAHAQVIRTWGGIEAYMPDEIPVIGPSATTPGLVHAFGFSGHGFQLGPAVGAVLAELVLDGKTPTPIDAFRITRFTGPAV